MGAGPDSTTDDIPRGSLAGLGSLEASSGIGVTPDGQVTSADTLVEVSSSVVAKGS